MKRSIITLISAAIALVFGACNKHSWDEEIDGRIPTKQIFEEHGDHGAHDGDHAHGDDHKKGEEDHKGDHDEKETAPAKD
jgi:hypothetical protein